MVDQSSARTRGAGRHDAAQVLGVMPVHACDVFAKGIRTRGQNFLHARPCDANFHRYYHGFVLRSRFAKAAWHHMPALSIRRRPTLAVGATRAATSPSPSSSHLVLVAQLSAPSGDTVQSTGDSMRAFSMKLRAARERHGLSLAAIAATTKIGVSHLAALERNDLSRWPEGLYRRAWIRAYAAAVYLPVEATVEDFVTTFETPRAPAEQEMAATADPSPGFRLTLAAPRARRWVSPDYVRQHAIDGASAVVLALLVAWWMGDGLWIAAGVLALCGYVPIVAALKRSVVRRLRTSG